MKKITGQSDYTEIQVKIRDHILNNLDISIYVSDLATNEILYANLALQRAHGNQPLTGRICWEALHNKSKRCEFCPIPYLLKHPGKGYQRERYNGFHEKICNNIIPWANGKLAHLQYIVDTSKDYL